MADRQKHWIKRLYIGADLSGALDPEAPSPQPLPAPGHKMAMFTFDWSDEELPETAFHFEPPPGSVETETLFEEALAAAREHPSLGSVAPAFEMARLDGENVSLQTLLQQHRVLVLDFWATWCAPCLAGLPTLVETTSKYAADGVGFYAINYREDEARIRAVMEERRFRFPVLMDRDGTVGQSFGIGGLPHTVVIDQSGTIRHVHIGADPAVKKLLAREIEVLCAEGAPPHPARSD